MNLRTLSTWMAGCAGLTIALVLSASAFVVHEGGKYLRPQDQLAAAEYGLLLGTDNPAAIERRAELALHLFHLEKIKRVIISGHPSNHGTDETDVMTKALVGKGTLRSKIELDPKGFTTRDSMLNIRTKGLSNFIVVTDSYHLNRALFIAARMNLHGQALLPDQPARPGWRVEIRERFARLKAVIQSFEL